MTDIDLGPLEYAPHATLIREMATRCAQDPRVQAIWVGGSLAAGQGDAYSDVDFRIAVESGQVEQWRSPDWGQYLPLPPCAGLLMRFGAQALLHHLILADGTIVDFFVQDPTHPNPEPGLFILVCRDAQLRATLEGFAQPASSLVRDLEHESVRQLFVDYWITTHKQMKALARKYDHSAFVGLYYERIALLRAWYMQATGKDIDSRATLHMLGALHKGLEGQLTAEQRKIVGLPSSTPEETVTAIEAVRAEMMRVGRRLADRHAFSYPFELEEVVQQAWRERKPSFMAR